MSDSIPVAELFKSVGVNGISVTATNLADILEQITVNLATSTAPITETLVPISISGLSASPTYVYSDGAPIAAPAPGQQVVEQWSIT